MTQILIACIGNIFLGDDGFGTEVARRLAGRNLPTEVIVKDFGIRGLDLTYALLDPYELVILVDACPRGGEPGTIYLVEPDPVESSASEGEPAHPILDRFEVSFRLSIAARTSEAFRPATRKTQHPPHLPQSP